MVDRDVHARERLLSDTYVRVLQRRLQHLPAERLPVLRRLLEVLLHPKLLVHALPRLLVLEVYLDPRVLLQKQVYLVLHPVNRSLEVLILFNTFLLGHLILLRRHERVIRLVALIVRTEH